MVNRTNGKHKIWLAILMIRFLVYINNKSITDNRFLFYVKVRLIELCPSLLKNIKSLRSGRKVKARCGYLYLYKQKNHNAQA